MQEEKVKKSYSVNIHEGDIIDNLVHFGHKTSMRNAQMKKHIFGTKNGIDIIHASHTRSGLEYVAQVFYFAAKAKKKILFVSSISSHKDLLEIFAKRCGAHYISSWTAGNITNYFNVIESMKRKFSSFEEMLSEENIKSLTKREIALITKKRDRIYEKLSGVLEMKGLPDILFVINSKIDALAIKEAFSCGIPVACICDSNASTEGVDYVIPGNDDGRKSVSFILNVVSDAIIQGVRDYMLDRGIDLSSILEKKN